MRRRFENTRTVAGGKIPVFACTISAPKTSWRNRTPILNIRDRSGGGYTSADYPASEVNNSIVCTMDGVPINCLTSVYSGYMEVLFNSGNVTGDITLQFTIGDVFYYFFITDKTNDIYETSAKFRSQNIQYYHNTHYKNNQCICSGRYLYRR